MKLNPDITQAPEDTIVLLAYTPYPFFLTGQRSKNFKGGIALVLPKFEVRPLEEWLTDDMKEFNEDPDNWVQGIAESGGYHFMNQYININPNEYSLVKPPAKWKLMGWLGIQSMEEAA